ncbi:uncharacterized protein LOC110689613 [Chenopodium quinoa]|uniref:uncharacterized protein LOC110689613 n=1 Tax=Chenopodium quinoa TaxID=63459 RepID=UPI000B794239|nr:uncharacterized protein LOC110689613 [Chenopodium quinoa]
MDVDNTTLEAREHESINHALERANSTSETPIVPLEPSSWENLQGVGENIFIVAPTPRRSARIRNKQFVEVLITKDSEIFLLENEEPTTYKQALASPNSDKWLEAMKSEMESMSKNEVWTLVDLPDGVLDRFEMKNSKRGFLPMSHGITLSKSQCPVMPDEMRRMAITPYASAIGSIMYAMICMRPDVAFALSMCSRFQANPGDAHWTIAKNILKYLRRTKGMFLVYGGEDELVVKGYTDASFQTDRDDFRS